MSYGAFAEFYDRLTGNVNYAAYARRVETLIRRYRPESKSIVELACGTMSLGLELAARSFDVLGLDISDDMLKIAEGKISQCEYSAKVARQDMREFELPHPADVFVCSLDGLNHLGGMDDIRKTFRAVRENIKPDGLLIFDMNTPYKHREVLSYNTFVYELPGLYCVWQNEYRERDCSVGITLDIFADSGNGYARHTEKFLETAYPKESVVRALRACGFAVIGMFDELKSSKPTPRTERILYVARRV